MSEMRHLAATGGPMKDLVMRALIQSGRWDVEAMREPGFRMMQQVLDGERNPEFRSAAPLPEKAQTVLDAAVVEVGMERLTVVADFLAAGLTYNLPDPLSVTQLEWYLSNKVGNAQRTMTPSARGENEIPAMLPYRLPVYITTDDTFIDIRTLKQSQRLGMPIDTNQIKQSTRAVNEAIEDAMINGATTLDGQALNVAGYTAPGLVNAPNAQTQALTLASWDATPVGTTVFAEVQAMMALARAHKKYGPYRLYIPTTVGAYFDTDYDATSGSRGLSIRERLLKIDGLEAIRSADLMPSTKVVLVQMTSDVVDIVVGQQPTVIPWTSLDGFTIYNLVMAIMIPRIRSDYDNKSGIVVGTIA